MSKINLSSRNLALGVYFAASFALTSSNALAHDATPVTVVGPVTVANPDDPAAFAKAQGIQHPFHENISCNSGSNLGCGGSTQLSTQRAVIEFLSGECAIPGALALQGVSLETVVGGTDVSQAIPILDHVGVTGAGGANSISFGGPARIYADANTLIQVAANGVGSVGPGTTTGFDCEVQISGQLVDVP